MQNVTVPIKFDEETLFWLVRRLDKAAIHRLSTAIENHNRRQAAPAIVASLFDPSALPSWANTEEGEKSIIGIVKKNRARNGAVQADRDRAEFPSLSIPVLRFSELYPSNF